MKKWIIIAMLTMVCVCLFAGCQNEPAEEVVQEQTQEVEQESAEEVQDTAEEAADTAEDEETTTEEVEEPSEEDAATAAARELARELEDLTAEELAAAQEQLSGQWIGSDGSAMWISFRDDICTVDIERQSGENSEYWHFGEYLGKKDDFVLVAVDCSKYQVTTESGFAQELVYEDGIAVIRVENGKITWEDATEDAGFGVTFEKRAA